jgi:hypothetical protein
MLYSPFTFLGTWLLLLETEIPVNARSKAWVCGRSLAGIASSDLTGDMAVCLSLANVFVLPYRNLDDGPIPRPEES